MRPKFHESLQEQLDFAQDHYTLAWSPTRTPVIDRGLSGGRTKEQTAFTRFEGFELLHRLHRLCVYRGGLY